MTLQEYADEYKELAELVLKALKETYSAGAVVGYTSNGTKLTYTNEADLRKSLQEYRTLESQANTQIEALKFMGVS